MPRIPEIVQRSTPRATGGIVPVPVDTSWADTAQLFENMGAGVDEIRQKQDDFDIANAETELLRSHVATLNSFDNDDDYATYTERYEKAMNEARENAGVLIRNPNARARFNQVAEVARIRGVAQTQDLARNKEGDLGRARLTDAISKNRETALLAKTEAERVLAVKTTQRMIEGARARGYIDADQAAVMARQAAEDYAVASVSRIAPRDRISMLKKGEAGSVVEYIPSDRRDQLIEQAEVEIAREEAALEAQAKLYREQNMKLAYDAVEAGKLSEVIGSKFWQDLTGAERKALREYDKAWRTGGEPDAEQSMDLYVQMMEIAKSDDPAQRERFLTHDLNPLRTDMRPQDYLKLVDLQATMRAAAKGEAEKKREAELKLQQYASEKQIVDGLLREMGLQPTTIDEDDAKRVNRFRDMVGSAIAEKKMLEERDLTSEETRTIAREVAKKYVVEDPWWRPQVEKRRFDITIEDIPADKLAEMRTLFKDGTPDDVLVSYYLENYAEAAE